MSPTPVTLSVPTAPGIPAGYAWEATNEAVAERYGLAREQILRFDLNTAPEPPGFAARILAAGTFDPPISDYPPADYRTLVTAAADVYGCRPEQLVVGAGADEVLDLCAKAFLPPGGRAVVPSPTYAMYRVLTEQRPATVVDVPRRPAADGHRLDVDAVRAAARDADLVWLCNPNNPTGRAEPAGAIEAIVAAVAEDATRARRRPPVVVIDEAYAEFVGSSHVPLVSTRERLVVVRTLSKAYALAGIRVGFAIARPDTVAELAPYRPPGSVSVPSVALGTAALRHQVEMRAAVDRLVAERDRLAAELTADGWSVGPSVTNFVLLTLDRPGRAAAIADGLLARGLVPRTFGAGHPLANALRLTVRTPDDDARLVEALRELRDPRR